MQMLKNKGVILGINVEKVILYIVLWKINFLFRKLREEEYKS